MFQKVNKVIVFILAAILLFCAYKLVVPNEIQPYAILGFAAFLSFGIYFGLVTSSSIPKKYYTAFSVLAFLNILVLVADYFYPEFLKTTWNYSFALLFLLLFSTLLFKLKKHSGSFAKFVFYLILVAGILIEIALIFKISTANFYTGLYYLLILVSASTLLLFGLEIKRNKTVK
ncbi:MAG: hypothetical protein RL265_326 [Bacteroidota bacterium]|jgi:hypothetical protein